MVKSEFYIAIMTTVYPGNMAKYFLRRASAWDILPLHMHYNSRVSNKLEEIAEYLGPCKNANKSVNLTNSKPTEEKASLN